MRVLLDTHSFLWWVMDDHMSPLASELAHALRVFTLPDIHRGPFDRILVAQSQVEQLPIVTADPQIRQYEVDVIW